MSFKAKLYALGGASCLLTVMIVLGLVFSPDRNLKRQSKGQLISAKALAKVEKIEIHTEEGQVSLSRAGDAWTMERAGVSHPADGERVEAFLKAVAKVEELRKISSKKEDYQKFGLGKEGERRLRLMDKGGSDLVSIAFGDNSTIGKDIYLAFEGKDAVYSTENRFSSYLQVDDRSWALLKVFGSGLKGEDIQGIDLSIDFPGGEGMDAIKTSYRISRDAKKGWKILDQAGKDLDPAACDELASDLAALEADAFVESGSSEAKALMDARIATLVIHSGKDKVYRLTVGGQDSQKRHVMESEGQPSLFYTSSWMIQSSFKTLDDLLKKSDEGKKPEKKKGKK